MSRSNSACLGDGEPQLCVASQKIVQARLAVGANRPSDRASNSPGLKQARISEAVVIVFLRKPIEFSSRKSRICRRTNYADPLGHETERNIDLRHTVPYVNTCSQGDQPFAEVTIRDNCDTVAHRYVVTFFCLTQSYWACRQERPCERHIRLAPHAFQPPSLLLTRTV